jgi:hypothetical protein
MKLWKKKQELIRILRRNQNRKLNDEYFDKYNISSSTDSHWKNWIRNKEKNLTVENYMNYSLMELEAMVLENL